MTNVRDAFVILNYREGGLDAAIYGNKRELKRNLEEIGVSSREAGFVSDFMHCHGNMVRTGLRPSVGGDTRQGFDSLCQTISSQSYYRKDSIESLLRDIFYITYGVEPE